MARRIEEDGRINLVVSKEDANGGTKDVIRNAGQISIVNFQSPQYLRRSGNGFFSNGSPGQDPWLVLLIISFLRVVRMEK